MFAPWLVAIPGLFLIYAGNARDRFGVMFCGGLWLLYGMYEHNVQATFRRRGTRLNCGRARPAASDAARAVK